MDSSDRDTVSARQDLRLVGPGHMIVPLTAALSYSRQDPYAVRMSLDVSLDEPVVWAFDRDLLAAALHAPAGIGEVRAWPSGGAGEKILNIVLGPPSGRARFEAGAAGIEAFLAEAYELVPAALASACLNIDAVLAELLSQA
jgi:hypothetical protein